jgi:hypothetical protein
MSAITELAIDVGASAACQALWMLSMNCIRL